MVDGIGLVLGFLCWLVVVVEVVLVVPVGLWWWWWGSLGGVLLAVVIRCAIFKCILGGGVGGDGCGIGAGAVYGGLCTFQLWH